MQMQRKKIVFLTATPTAWYLKFSPKLIKLQGTPVRRWKINRESANNTRRKSRSDVAGLYYPIASS